MSLRLAGAGGRRTENAARAPLPGHRRRRRYRRRSAAGSGGAGAPNPGRPVRVQAPGRELQCWETT